jgi:ABC-type glycerol-3-phosphate transport system substrate-binding protein
MATRYPVLGTWLCGLAAAALALVACGGSTASTSSQQSTEKVKLVYFNARMAEPVERALVQKYMQLHPNVTIDYLSTTSMPGPSDTDAIANLIFNVQAKTVVDVAKVEISRTPLDLMGAKADLNLSTINADAVQSRIKDLLNTNYVQFDKGVWALPYEYDPFGYVYNATLFKQAGINKPPKTWDEMRQDNRTIQAKFPGTWAICSPIQNLSKIQPYVWSANGHYWDRDVLPTRADFLNPGMEAAYSFAQEWAQNGWMNTSEINATTSIQWMVARKCAAMNYSSNLAATLKVNDPATDWQVAPIPVQTANDKAINYAGGSALVIPSTSKYPKQALDFMLWLTSKEGQALKFGQDPSLGLARTDIFNQALPTNKQVSQQLSGNADWKAALSTSNVPTRPSGVSPIYSSAYQALADMQQRIILKRTNVTQELTQTQAQVQQLIDQSKQKNPELYK